MRAIALCRRAADLALLRAAAALGEAVALCVAPEEEIQPLVDAARAAGAGRGVRVWDAALATTDYLGVAYTLAAAVRAVGDPAATATVILAGDRGRGVVGPAVAERLGVPLLGQVVAVEVRDGKLVARRRGRDVLRTFAAAPPALICLIVDGPAASVTAAPAAATTAGGAGGAVEAWGLAKVGLSAAELGYRKHFAPRQAQGPTPKPRSFADVAALARRLGEDGLLRGGQG